MAVAVTVAIALAVVVVVVVLVGVVVVVVVVVVFIVAVVAATGGVVSVAVVVNARPALRTGLQPCRSVYIKVVAPLFIVAPQATIIGFRVLSLWEPWPSALEALIGLWRPISSPRASHPRPVGRGFWFIVGFQGFLLEFARGFHKESEFRV